MNRVTRATLAAAALIAAGSAGAQVYLGAAVGPSKARLDCAGTTGCDKTDTAYKPFVGWMFAPYWGLEAAYYNQGKATLTARDATLGEVEAEFKGHGWGLYGRAVLPLGDTSLFAKLGAVSSTVKLDATSSVFGGAGASERHTGAAWGFGAGYAFTGAWSARLEYERVRTRFMDERINVDLWTVGGIYRF